MLDPNDELCKICGFSKGRHHYKILHCPASVDRWAPYRTTQFVGEDRDVALDPVSTWLD